MRATDTIRAGRLRSLVTFKIRPVIRDTFGGKAQNNSATVYATWETYATAYAEIVTDRGRELQEGKRDVSETFKRIRIRYNPAIVLDETMMCLHGGKAYDIQGIDNVGERNKTVDITVREIK